MKRISWSKTSDRTTNERINCVASLWIEGVISEEEASLFLLNWQDSEEKSALAEKQPAQQQSLEPASVRIAMRLTVELIVQQLLLLLAMKRSYVLGETTPFGKMAVLRQVDGALEAIHNGRTRISTNSEIDDITQAWISAKDPSMHVLPKLGDYLAETEFAFVYANQDSIVEKLRICLDGVALELAANACLPFQHTEPQERRQIFHLIRDTLLQACNGKNQHQI